MFPAHPVASIVAPDAGLAVYTVLLLFGCVGGLVTLAKGRYGWFLVGLLTGGVLWNLTAILIATPDSLWARHFYGPHKIARARRQFPTRSARP